MSVDYSDAVLDGMGFRDPIGAGSIDASFMSVTVYEARGVTLPEGFARACQGRVAGVDYRIALAGSVNAACQHTIGDNFIESEPQWSEETQASGPYALVAVGPTKFIACKAGRMQRMPDGGIETFDCFGEARSLLRSLNDRALPPLVAAVTLALDSPGHYASLRSVSQANAGRTAQGQNVQDMHIDLHAEGYISRALDSTEAIGALDTSVKRAPQLHQQAARYFALGTSEDDVLKKFLFFFLALEIETHAVFGRIDHVQKLRSQVLATGPQAPRTSVADLLTRDVAGWNNLADRFVWCATCVWTRLAEDDIKLFKELKKVRDQMAHGRVMKPSASLARQAELLAHRVLWV